MKRFSLSLIILIVLAAIATAAVFHAPLHDYLKTSPAYQHLFAEEKTTNHSATQSTQATTTFAPQPVSDDATAAPAENAPQTDQTPAVDNAQPTLANTANADTTTNATPTPAANPAANAPAIHGVYNGKVVDAANKTPIAGAIITFGDQAVLSAADGSFHIDGVGNALKVRARGYAKQTFLVNEQQPSTEIALNRFVVKGLYLTAFGLSNQKIRTAALEAAKTNNMNTLVIDVKDDHGLIYFNIGLPMATEIGAQQKILIKDMPALMADLKSQGFYLIARVAIFKDNTLALAKPQWAVKKNGQLYLDNQKMGWTDPFIPEVQNYNISVVKAAAAIGFDEVQIDYVRFPDTKGVVFTQPTTAESRSNTIHSFMVATQRALIPYNIPLSADIFGYVLWNTGDTGIGQEIDKVVSAVDVVSPMLYPSGFQWGIPGYRNPVQNPYEIIYLTLKRGQNRTNASSLQFRPWLQAFHDYAFGGGDFSEDRMRAQIQAAEDFGAEGYLFWNPRNVYPKGVFTNTAEHRQKHNLNVATASSTPTTTAATETE